MPRTSAILTGHWRPLLAVIAPPLALASLLQTLVTMLAAGHHGVIFRGELIGPGGQDWVGALIWVAAWLVAAPAGMVIAAGAARGIAVGPAAAVRFALSRVRSVALIAGLVIVAGSLLMVLLSVAVGVVGVVALVALVFIAVLLARLAVALPAALLEGPGYVTRAQDVMRGRTLYAGWVFVLGFVLLPWGAGHLTGLLRGLPDSPAFAAPVALAVLTVVVTLVAVQATSLTVVYLEPRSSDDTHPAADLDAVDATLVGVGGRESGPGLLGLAGLAVAAPALIGLLVTFINPYAAPVLAETQIATQSDLTNLGVLPDGRPVVIAERQVVTCDQPTCDSGERSTPLPPRDVLAATVLDDGSIVAVARDAGQDAVEATLYRCTTASCAASRLRLTGMGWTWHAAAVSLTPNGRLTVAALIDGPRPAEVVLWNCADVSCARPTRTALPTFSGFGSGGGSGTAAHIAIGADERQRPVIAWSGERDYYARVARCDNEECTRIEQQTAAAPITAAPGSMKVLAGMGIDQQGKLVLAIAAGRAARDGGLDLHIGPDDDRILLVRCDSDDCSRRSGMRPWHSLEDYRQEWIWIAFTRDGAPVLAAHAGDDSGIARVITCVRHCFTGWS